MTDHPDHEMIERVMETEPKALIERLPDCTESREARRLVDVTVKLVHIAREKAPRPNDDE